MSLREQLDQCHTVQQRVLVMRHRAILERLTKFEMRDRWGYPLAGYSVAEHVDWLVKNKPGLSDEELVDAWAVEQMAGDLTVLCEGYDTPLDDEGLLAIIEAVFG